MVVKMDAYSDDEVESIWKRQKSYIDPSKFDAKDSDDLARQIEEEMKKAGKVSGKKGDMQRLIDAGFARRVVKIQSLRESLDAGRQHALVKAKVVGVKSVSKRDIVLPKNISQRANGRLAIKKASGQVRVLKQENVNIVKSMRKGRPAYYVSSKGKRITWGFL